MNRIAAAMRMLLVATLALCMFSGAVFAQRGSADDTHHQVNLNLIKSFLEKYGYTKYRVPEMAVDETITFRVKDQKTEITMDFYVVLVKGGELMKIECRGSSDTPLDRANYNLALERINQLNGERTIGKFVIQKDGKTVRYFHYRNVADGLSYTGFIKTLRMFMWIAFNDFKEIEALLE